MARLALRFPLIPLLLAGCLFATSAAHAEDGVTEKMVTVGQFAALSGPNELLGKRIQTGIQVYFNEVNGAGGVNGRQLKLVSRDDGYEPTRSAVAVKQLIDEDKVFALLGSVGTPTTSAAIPLLTERKVPLLGPVTGAESLRDPFNRYVFHVRAGYNDEAEKIIQFLAPSGLKRIGLLYQNDSYGKAGLEAVMAAAKRNGVDIVSSATVERNSLDVDTAVATILKGEPQAIVQFSTYKTVAAFIKKARDKGYHNQFFNVSFVGSSALAKEMGSNGDRAVVISQVVPFPFAPSNLVVKSYQDAMKKFSDGQLDFSSMEGYLIGRVFVEGLSKAGKNPTRESLIAALEQIKGLSQGLANSSLSYGPQMHTGGKFVEMTFLSPEGRFLH